MRRRLCGCRSRVGAILSALFLLFTAGGVTLGDQGATGDSLHWEMLAASGKVVSRAPLTETHTWNDVRRGQALLPRTILRTGPDGRTTLSWGRQALRIDTGVQLQLPPGCGSRSFIQDTGRVVYDFDGRRSPGVKVVTPHMTVGMKGKTLLVTVTERYAAVTLREGTAIVSDPRTDEFVQIRNGETAVVDAAPGKAMEIVSSASMIESSRRSSSDDAQRIARTERDRMRAVMITSQIAEQTYWHEHSRAHGISSDPHGVRLAIRKYLASPHAPPAAPPVEPKATSCR